MTVKKIYLNGVETEYVFVRKNVKNVNLRIKDAGMIYVSANRRTSKDFVESFLKSKADWILNAKKKCENRNNEPLTEYFTESTLKSFILSFCREVYPYYEKRGIAFPLIKFRKMKTMWGNCRAERKILTFSLNLKYAPPECVKYVIYHEFTHFIIAGHGKAFYEELSKVCPDWKRLREELKKIHIK